ncbi:NAD-dependent epimerase, partial [Pseudomonas aeruginosa]|nr:NAD-dependent epimerase [Pseudomonas aeruginosa]MCR3787330.1 NAD-dependent epimerase [Pseudomonas aeruginosa]
MRNLETATLKLGIFHPHDSLSQALIAAALQRQIEVSALQADLNSLQARPGLRCKPASLASSIEVSQ